MADDIGWFNVSCYNHGIMGYRTPNIDRIAREGAMFTDFLPAFAAAAGEPDIVAKLKKGHNVGGTNFKVHIDGFNLLPFLSGKESCPCDGLIYWSDGDLMALRAQQYKIVFAEQAVVHQWLESFKEFPPRQKAASFTVDQIVEKRMPQS